MIGFVAFLALGATLTPSQAGGVSIQWKLKKNDIFYVQTVGKSEQTIKMNGETQPQKQDDTSVYQYEVMKAAKDGYVLEQTILAMSSKSNPDRTGGVDQYAKVVGSKFTFHLGADFRVKKIEGVEDLLDKVSGKNPQIKQIIKGIWNDDTFKAPVEQLFRCGTDKPVKSGESWKSDYRFPVAGMGEVNAKLTNKVIGIKGDAWEVSHAGDPKFSAIPSGIISDANIQVDKFEGVMRFDTKRGILKESTLEIHMSGTMTMNFSNEKVNAVFKQERTIATEVSLKNPIAK